MLEYVIFLMLEEWECKEVELVMKEVDEILWFGGYFVVCFDVYFLDLVKGKWLEIVVKCGGEEVICKEGIDSVFNVFSFSFLKMWWIMIIVFFEQFIIDEFVDVYVVYMVY